MRRIEEHLGTLPATALRDEGERCKLPETPLEMQEAVLAKVSERARAEHIARKSAVR